MPIDSVKAFLPNIYHVSSHRRTHIYIQQLLLKDMRILQALDNSHELTK